MARGRGKVAHAGVGDLVPYQPGPAAGPSVTRCRPGPAAQRWHQRRVDQQRRDGLVGPAASGISNN
eukprot:7791632-Heterocapsa_arctica.AAC.1